MAAQGKKTKIVLDADVRSLGSFPPIVDFDTLLNKKQALPNEDMAQALGMSDVAYRVTVHRIKCNMNKVN